MNQPNGAVGGHVPPHDLDAEEHILGALMLPRCPVEAVTEAVGTDDFYRPEFGTIFMVAVEMFERGDPVEPLTVAAELEARGVLTQVGVRRGSTSSRRSSRPPRTRPTTPGSSVAWQLAGTSTRLAGRSPLRPRMVA